jgi:thiol-disulfide isomerase/thioredoxin
VEHNLSQPLVLFLRKNPLGPVIDTMKRSMLFPVLALVAWAGPLPADPPAGSGSPPGFGVSTEFDLAVAPAALPLDKMARSFDELYSLDRARGKSLMRWNRTGQPSQSKELNTIAVGFSANTGYYVPVPGSREGIVSRDIDFGITYHDLSPDGSLTARIAVNDNRATPKAVDNRFKVETRLTPGTFRLVRLGPPQAGRQAWLALAVTGEDRSLTAVPVMELDFDHDRPIDLQFSAVDGRLVDTAKLRGKVVLVDFWATWCGPCIAALPTLEDLYQRYHALGLEVIGVSLDGDRATLETFLKTHPHPWPQYFVPGATEMNENPLAQRFGVHGVPAFILIDKKGLGTTLDIRNPDTDDRIEAKLK